MKRLRTFDPIDLIRLTDRRPELVTRLATLRDARLHGDDADDLPDDENCGIEADLSDEDIDDE